jgi:branched-chain amino acid transport system substrate-binding protein
MTGDLAVYGAQMRKGAELAVADINAAGGVLGKPLRLIVQDDQCKPGRANSVAHKVAAQDVVAVIGHFCSGVSIPASEVYAESDILQITPSSSNPDLTEQAFRRGWKTVFRSYVRDDRLGFAAASYLAEHYATGRIALLQDDSNYARTIEKPLLRGLVAYGIEPVFQDQISAGHSSYQETIDALIAARPDAIYYMGYYPEAALLVEEARASGLQAAFLGSDSLMTTDFVDLAGSAADGVMFIANQGAQGVPEAADLLARLRAQGADADRTGEDYAVFTYAAFQEFAMAAQRAGTAEAEAVAKALRNGSFDTVMGTIAFDEEGDLRDQRFSWYRFRAGSYELVP